jgi:hypothetical protein
MKRILIVLTALLAILSLTGCSLSLLGLPKLLPSPILTSSPTSLPNTPTPAASATSGPPSSTPTLSLPTTTPTLSLPTITPGPSGPTATSAIVPTATTGGIPIGSPSGPYAVIQVDPGDMLKIHSAPGAGASVIGSFTAGANTVMRTGNSSDIAGDLWVEVQNPGGGTGWVNAAYLTEYVAPSAFCSDARLNTLIANLGKAFTARDGALLASLASPAHGVTVYLWRNGNGITFDREHARWVFDSTYSHNWGMAPASGLETIGSFQEQVLPELQDVFNASYSLTCNSLGTAPQYGLAPWPEQYAHVNYYSVFKPGSPGVDLDWRYWLAGVDYVQGQPYVFALIHFAWEP